MVSKPSESRGKPETSVEAPRVEKELLSTIVALQGKTLEPYTDHQGMLHRRFVLDLADSDLYLSNVKAYVWL